MLRRLLTLASAVSLVLCAASAYFWWRTARDGMGGVELRAPGLAAEAFCSANGLDVTVTRAWPGPTGARADWGTAGAEATPRPVQSYRAGTPTEWRWLGLGGERGAVSYLVGPDGRVRELTDREFFGRPLADDLRWSDPLPYWAVADAPPWLGVAAAAPLPVAWLAVRLTRSVRGRRLAGKCRSCGYDLRATPGRCPECGTVPADEASRV